MVLSGGIFNSAKHPMVFGYNVEQLILFLVGRRQLGVFTHLKLPLVLGVGDQVFFFDVVEVTLHALVDFKLSVFSPVESSF